MREDSSLNMYLVIFIEDSDELKRSYWLRNSKFKLPGTLHS